MIWNEEVVIDMIAYFLQALLQASVIYNELRVEEKRQSYWIFVGLYFLSLVIRIFMPGYYWWISIIVVGVLFIYGKRVSPFHPIEVLLTILFYQAFDYGLVLISSLLNSYIFYMNDLFKNFMSLIGFSLAAYFAYNNRDDFQPHIFITSSKMGTVLFVLDYLLGSFMIWNLLVFTNILYFVVVLVLMINIVVMRMQFYKQVAEVNDYMQSKILAFNSQRIAIYMQAVSTMQRENANLRHVLANINALLKEKHDMPIDLPEYIYDASKTMTTILNGAMAIMPNVDWRLHLLSSFEGLPENQLRMLLLSIVDYVMVTLQGKQVIFSTKETDQIYYIHVEYVRNKEHHQDELMAIIDQMKGTIRFENTGISILLNK
ncbi:hypothetical protein [Sharpea azabuensis]|uniref:Uncharacterized protein n=1 Tax=Sharpea azabuensis TaxID=322505 RepID=A0A1H6TGS0_9FIRM|nr:hypothetical protein [Sharpea azabuensis]SEI79211.1 hypothetical protein SAMN04487834_102428 [Sharpea azabuensis]